MWSNIKQKTVYNTIYVFSQENVNTRFKIYNYSKFLKIK